ncbi:hypothetical protein [Parasulfitobacter algicola]|uniref:Uncharacterized protein n=1 Tax=Parasulfitobacter algicola TaxID=2614809 RepID=A0ABX2IZD9_9RHOB|nr:hypothetical protein [Sulfitobacter algicola]NSX56094.1 hypothetical protein [Sulfitobacter algicola]
MLKRSPNSNLNPLFLAGGFAVLNIAIFFAVTQLSYGLFFSFGYFLWVICVSGVAFPLALIGYRVFVGKWAWWSVALACVISAAVSVMHFWMIAVSATVV